MPRSITGTIRDRRPLYGMSQPTMEPDPNGPPEGDPLPPPPGPNPPPPDDGGPVTGGPAQPPIEDGGGLPPLELPPPPIETPPPVEAPPDYTGTPAQPPEESGIGPHRLPPPPMPGVGIPGTFATPANPAALQGFRTPAFTEGRFSGGNASFGPGTPLAGQDGDQANSFEELLRRLRGGQQ